MGDCWPPSVGLRGQALNHPVLRWLKTVVVSDQGNGAAGPRQVGTRKTRQKRADRGDPVRALLLKRRKPQGAARLEGRDAEQKCRFRGLHRKPVRWGEVRGNRLSEAIVATACEARGESRETLTPARG